jgi:hypothetical protein
VGVLISGREGRKIHNTGNRVVGGGGAAEIKLYLVSLKVKINSFLIIRAPLAEFSPAELLKRQTAPPQLSKSVSPIHPYAQF